jgi:hypothetical protein
MITSVNTAGKHFVRTIFPPLSLSDKPVLVYPIMLAGFCFETGEQVITWNSVPIKGALLSWYAGGKGYGKPRTARDNLYGGECP